MLVEQRAASATKPERNEVGQTDFLAVVLLACLVVFVVVARIATAAAAPGQEAANDSVPSASPTVEPTLSATQRQALIQQATLRTAVRACGAVTHGSGVIIDGYLVTNAHVVGGGVEIKADQPIEPVVVPVVALDPQVDLAAAEPPAGVTLGLASDRAVAPDSIVGTEVLLAGHVDGRTLEIRTGTVALRASGAPYGIGSDVLLIDAETRGGYSGGPVLDSDGRVIAILTGFDRVTERSIAIPADVVRSFLETASAAEAPDPAGRESCGG